jgi:hypothetical protein
VGFEGNFAVGVENGEGGGGSRVDGRDEGGDGLVEDGAVLGGEGRVVCGGEGGDAGCAFGLFEAAVQWLVLGKARIG